MQVAVKQSALNISKVKLVTHVARIRATVILFRVKVWVRVNVEDSKATRLHILTWLFPIPCYSQKHYPWIYLLSFTGTISYLELLLFQTNCHFPRVFKIAGFNCQFLSVSTLHDPALNTGKNTFFIIATLLPITP